MYSGKSAEITSDIIGCACKVHSTLGPGMLESVYEVCLAHELVKQGYAVQRQVPISVEYDGIQLEAGFRLDLIVENKVVVELKTVEQILPVHKAQIITYLKLMQKSVGLLLNFHVARMTDGIRRFVL